MVDNSPYSSSREMTRAKPVKSINQRACLIDRLLLYWEASWNTKQSRPRAHVHDKWQPCLNLDLTESKTLHISISNICTKLIRWGIHAILRIYDGYYLIYPLDYRILDDRQKNGANVLEHRIRGQESSNRGNMPHLLIVNYRTTFGNFKAEDFT